MTLIIELDPQLEAKLAAAAKRKGLAEPKYLMKLLKDDLGNQVDESRAEQRVKNQSTIELFAKWREEDANMTPEEIEEDNRIQKEFEADINQSRMEQGMRLL